MPDEEQHPITVTFQNKETIKKVVDLLVKTKPKGWARRSYASYYKKPYAEWIQKALDEMMVDRQPRVYRLDLFPRISLNSLYLRVNQSIMYLLDPENGMDIDGKYKMFVGVLKIKRIPRVGVSMTLDPVIEGAEQPIAEKYIGDTDKPKWKQKMDLWIEDSSIEEPFHQEGLMLTPEEIAQLELELDGSGILCSIDSRSIKLMKP